MTDSSTSGNPPTPPLASESLAELDGETAGKALGEAPAEVSPGSVVSATEDGEDELEDAASAGEDRALRDFRRTHKGLLPEEWRIKLPVFEGPLDLLLHLIRIQQIEISDIPVALICDQYHEYLDLMEELDLDIAGEYVYEAALLIHVKSRLLLPQPKVEPGEEAPPDPRQELVDRLLEYQRIKEVAQTFAEVVTVRQGLWTRARQEPPVGDSSEDGELDLGDLSLFDLLSVFRKVLDRYDREHPDAMVVRAESFSLRDQFERLLKRLSAGRPLDFFDDLLSLSCRAEAIAAFLAVLELGRLQLIRLHRSDDGRILLYRTIREVVAEELEAITG
jgi:segregation and condensation protein A